MECKHLKFSAETRVARLEDINVFVFEAKVQCSDCKQFFRFKNLEAGVSFLKPMVSADGLELRAPIEANDIPKVALKGSYSVPLDYRLCLELTCERRARMDSPLCDHHYLLHHGN